MDAYDLAASDSSQWCTRKVKLLHHQTSSSPAQIDGDTNSVIGRSIIFWASLSFQLFTKRNPWLLLVYIYIQYNTIQYLFAIYRTFTAQDGK